MEAQLKVQSLPVKGMDCASCAMTIEKSLKKLDGVNVCEVNYATEKVKVEYDPKKIDIDKMNEKISPLGYTIKNPEKQTSEQMNMTEEEHMKMGHMGHSEHLGLNQSKEEKLKELKSQENKMKIVLPLTLLTFFLMMWEIGSMSFSWIPKFPVSEEVYNPILFVFATIIILWIGSPFIKGVTTFIKYRVANMDSLVGIGTLTAYLYSAVLLLFPNIKTILSLPDFLYFDASIIVIGFVSFGKFLETRSKLQTGEAIEKLINLQAKTALIIKDGVEIEVPIEQVKIGDLVIVKPGGKVAVDGVIQEGYSSIDESMITGESIPIDKKIGDSVIGGTINKQGSFQFKATKVGSETMLSQIIKLVEEAQGSRAPIQKLADKISEYFVPVVLIISIVTVIGWLLIGTQFLGFSQAFSYAITCFVGVLVIACPCALGLATPTAIIVGTGKGAENGILIKDAESLEKLYKTNIIVVDKTGTITNGKPKVTDVILENNSNLKTEIELLSLLASLENKSEHPLAIAILEKAKELNLKLDHVENFEIVEGKGIVGNLEVNGKSEKFYGGNIRFMNEKNLKVNDELVEKLTSAGKTPIVLASESEILGYVGVADTLKDGIKEQVNEIHKLGIKIVMVTGDHVNTAKYIADQAGIKNFIAGVLPTDKADIVKAIQNNNLEYLQKFGTSKFDLRISNVVGMVGDGINDAPALAQADIGIAMGNGTDVAIESAQVILLHGDFSKLIKAIKLSKSTMNTIKQNLFWAFFYNVIGIPLASGLLFPFFGILLNPAFAGLAMAFSSVSVVSNSLRLRFAKI